MQIRLKIYYYFITILMTKYLVLQISTGVLIGNLLTAAIVVAISPYVKVERQFVTTFFK
jgi:hypothetical protein